MNTYFVNSSLKFGNAIYDNLSLKNTDAEIDKTERKYPASTIVHERYKIRETLHAFQDVGPLVASGLLESERPFKLGLKEFPLHIELGQYQLCKTDIVADVGTGAGLVPRLLSRAGVKCYANALGLLGRVAYLERMHATLPDSLARRLTIVKGSKKSAMLPEASVDVVNISNTFHHFRKASDMLSSISASLRPGGRVLVLEHFADLEVSFEPSGDGYGCKRSQPFQTHVDAFTKAGFKMTRV